MRFNPCKCPECGELMKGTSELTPGIALVSFDEHGEAEYDGETKMYWDGQTTERDKDGRVLCVCESGHEWFAECDD